MKNKHERLGHRVQTVILAMLCLMFLTSSVSIAFGQKKPGSLNQGTTPDDKKLCKVKDDQNDLEWTNDDSEFCKFYKIYAKNMDDNPATAQKARNRMIDLVQSQIETYYKARKDNRKTLVANLQMIFDILEIGTAAATGIIKGTLRAKSVLAQALSGFQAGRTAANRNFEILQTQVLINTMKSNRAKIKTEIATGKSRSVDDYSWYKAKDDLTRLLNAGTFSEALDKLVEDTGTDVARAEAELRIVENNLVTGAATETDLTLARGAFDVESKLEDDLGKTGKPATDALAKLRSIVKKLEEDDEIKKLLGAESISSTSDGQPIIDALDKIKTDATRFNRRDMVRKINSIIIELGS
jgi:hypothetical protein